jgi:uncharacterized protein (DUF2236 family)
MVDVAPTPAGSPASPDAAGQDPMAISEPAAPAQAWDEAVGLFGPDSETWRLDREAWLLLGAGPRALLLQLAHPMVAAGVADHSDFRSDPWARLRGTLRSYLRIVYGSRSVALAEVRRLNALHRAITGTGYEARDPDLSLWVHATLVDSTLVTYSAWREPLPEARAAAAYAESVPIGRAFGIPPSLLPPDLDRFRAYVEGMLAPSGPVHPTPVARELATHVLRPTLAPFHPALGRVPRGIYSWPLWPAVGLLPLATRTEYALAWSPGHEAVSRWLVAGWRRWAMRLPVALRQMPQARAADRRVGQYQRGNRAR